MFGKRGSHPYLSYGTRSDPRTTPRHTSTSEKGPKIWVLLAEYMVEDSKEYVIKCDICQ